MLRVAALITLLTSPVLANPAPLQSALDSAASSRLAVASSLRPVARARDIPLPTARWGASKDRSQWTMAIVSSLRSHASILPDTVPHDIGAWCPGYARGDRSIREAFWVGLVSSLAWHESTHRPTAVGGGGLWYGLTQIYPDTARRYGCKARSGSALKDPVDNLTCAMRIMAVTVPRDNVVSKGMRGVAADWGPFHSRRKREDMREWTRSQSYCAGMTASLRPVARPDGLGPDPIALLAEMRPKARPAPEAILATKSEN